MKKIMFNDKYELTKAVLEGRKTMTRRIISEMIGRKYKKLPQVREDSQDGSFLVFNDADDLEPIILYPKYKVGEVVAVALEKNGFTRPNERVRYFTESTDYYDVDIHEITDSIWCFEYQNCEAHFPPYLILIAHVHELQHVLRLCGIEKNIEL